MGKFNLNKISYNSPVILTFVLISLGALILNFLTGGYTNTMFFCVYRSSFADPLTYVRLVGHVFGHAGFDHFFGNMLLILLLGPILEEKYGSKTIALLIFFTAIVTGLFQITFSNNGLLGASGIVFMFIILTSVVNIQKGKIPLTLILIFIMYIGNEIILGITSVDNVSRITHILGGILGAIFGYVLNARKNIK